MVYAICLPSTVKRFLYYQTFWGKKCSDWGFSLWVRYPNPLTNEVCIADSFFVHFEKNSVGRRGGAQTKSLRVQTWLTNTQENHHIWFNKASHYSSTICLPLKSSWADLKFEFKWHHHPKHPVFEQLKSKTIRVLVTIYYSPLFFIVRSRHCLYDFEIQNKVPFDSSYIFPLWYNKVPPDTHEDT